MKINLDLIEAHLQALIEGSVGKFFPLQRHNDLALRLVEAMRAGIRTLPGGEVAAPNLYYLKINPAQAQVLQNDPAWLANLTETLRRAGAEAGLTFPSSPVIRLSSDASLASGDWRVEAFNSQDNLPHTTDLTLDENREPEAIPHNAFLIVDGTQVFNLTQSVINIGRRLDNQLVIDDPRISRVHAQLRAVRGRYVIFDLGSKGGTLVNGAPVHQSPLYPGDVISLAGLPLVYGQDSAHPSDTQAMAPQPGGPPDPEIIG